MLNSFLDSNNKEKNFNFEYFLLVNDYFAANICRFILCKLN